MTETLQVKMKTDAETVSELQRTAEGDLSLIETLEVECDETYEMADSLLTEVVTKKDAAVKMRQSATQPLKQVIKTVESWFLPVVRALTKSESHLKSTMGDYRVALAEREAAAREAAAKAAEENKPIELMSTLEHAQELSEPPAGRATSSLVWVVDQVTAIKLPREYMTPDAKKIAAVARKHKGDEPPVIAGVTFKRKARIGARR